MSVLALKHQRLNSVPTAPRQPTKSLHLNSHDQRGISLKAVLANNQVGSFSKADGSLMEKGSRQRRTTCYIELVALHIANKVLQFAIPVKMNIL